MRYLTVDAATADRIAATCRMLELEIDVAHRRHPGATADTESVPMWRCLAALTEEVGEVARALHDDEGGDRVRAELVQVATVAILWASRRHPEQ